jgi:hypothetical protein
MRSIMLDNFIEGDIREGRIVGLAEDKPAIKYGPGMDWTPGVRWVTKRLRDEYGSTPLVGAEIGVSCGINAVSILSNLNMKKLYLVDPYVCIKGSYYDLPRENVLLRNALRLAVYNLLPYTERIHWIHAPSFLAYKYLEPLDFVYIDGGHSYEEVLEDCRLMWDIVKPGGLISGHDWGVPGVMAAVNKFSGEHILEVTYREDDWWARRV